MKILCEGATLSISEIEELGLANSDRFGREVCAALGDDVKSVVIDLSSTSFMDCTGLGALAALSKAARKFNGGISVQLVNPTPLVRRIAGLTGLEMMFQTNGVTWSSQRGRDLACSPRCATSAKEMTLMAGSSPRKAAVS